MLLSFICCDRELFLSVAGLMTKTTAQKVEFNFCYFPYKSVVSHLSCEKNKNDEIIKWRRRGEAEGC